MEVESRLVTDMAKKTKTKKSKKSSKADEHLPDLVDVMARFVEKLDSLEKRIDFLGARMTSLPAELKMLIQGHSRSSHEAPAPAQQPSSGASLSGGKVLYEAVCADCCKTCKVPFRPKEGRPVYCPECFAIRKAGHAPRDLVSDIKIPPTLGQTKSASPIISSAAPAKETAAPKRKAPTKSKKPKRAKKSR